MKIVIATPLYPPDIGGPATYAPLLSKGLIERNHTIFLVKFGDVRHLPKVIRHIVYFCSIYRKLKNADMVFALDPVSTGLPAYIAARVCRKPLVVDVVGDYAWEQGKQRFGVTASLDDFVNMRRVPLAVWFLRRIQIMVASHAKKVIVDSVYLKNIVTAWGILPEKINVVYNSMQQEISGVVPKIVKTLSQQNLIVTVGRLVPWKNIEGIIDAVTIARSKDASATLVVIGDGPERLHLEEYAKKTLGDACIFTGALSHADVLAVMRSARVFVLNSSYEGFSHVLIESLSLGIPSIATRAGGNSEVITDGEDGILVQVHNTNALADIIVDLLSNESLHERVSVAAKKSSARFSENTMLEKTTELLINL